MRIATRPLPRPLAALAAAALVLAPLAGCGGDPEPAPERGPEGITPTAGADGVEPLGTGPVLLTGAPGGAYHETGRALARSAAGAGQQVSVLPTRGSVETLYLLAWGMGDLGIVQADVLQSPAHRVARQAVRVIQPLFLEEVHALVQESAAIGGLADLAGKRVGIGPAGSGTALTAQALLEAAGLDPAFDVQIDRSESGQALAKLRAGELDAVILVGGAPLSALEAAPGLKLLAVDEATVTRLREANPNYRATTVVYPALQPGSAVATVAIPAVLVARDGADVAALEATFAQVGTTAGGHPKAAEVGKVTLEGDETLPGLAVAYRDPALPLRLVTGAEGGTYHVAGEGIARALRGSETEVEHRTSTGSLRNLILLATGEAELAIVQEDVLFETLRSPAIAPLLARVRLIAPLFKEEVHVVTRPGLAPGSLEALTGMKVAVGEMGSGTLLTASRILERAGLDHADLDALPLGSKAALERLQAGTLDAAFMVGGQPLPLLVGADVGFLPLGGVESYFDTELTAYGKGAVSTVATRAVLLSRFDLSEEAAAAVVQAIYANRHNLARTHVKWNELHLPALSEAELGLQYHGGVKSAAAAGVGVDTGEAW